MAGADKTGMLHQIWMHHPNKQHPAVLQRQPFRFTINESPSQKKKAATTDLENPLCV